MCGLLAPRGSARPSCPLAVYDASQLDQEEALAFVLAELLGLELLPGEARNIGELARLAAVAYKGQPPGSTYLLVLAARRATCTPAAAAAADTAAYGSSGRT